MLLWLSVAAMGVIAFLCWTLYRHLDASRIEALTDKRRATSLVAGRGEFVDGNRHLKVALALTRADLFYENGDMQASLDLRWVREIEYDTRLATGAAIEGGEVLRIRCFSQVFEFILPVADVARWRVMLPPRGGDALPVELEPQLAIAT